MQPLDFHFNFPEDTKPAQRTAHATIAAMPPHTFREFPYLDRWGAVDYRVRTAVARLNRKYEPKRYTFMAVGTEAERGVFRVARIR
jgi:hypothetical protein